MTEWKRQHANESEKALETRMVRFVMEELASNLGHKNDALVMYGIEKVASYAAQAARAQALGFDPELLRLSSDETNQEQLKLAQLAIESGRPVRFIRPPATVQACPVCEGRGWRPVQVRSEGTQLQGSRVKEQCHCCNGGGLLWLHTGRPVKEGLEEEDD